MNVLTARAAVIAVTIGLMSAGIALQVLADVKDYEFQLVQSKVKMGDAVVTVRLVDKRSGKPVPGAIIFAKRIDMAPEGMEAMAAAIEQLPSSETGVYRFKTDLSMAGKWQLSLGAKVQGEAGKVESRLVIEALK